MEDNDEFSYASDGDGDGDDSDGSDGDDDEFNHVDVLLSAFGREMYRLEESFPDINIFISESVNPFNPLNLLLKRERVIK